MFISDFALLPSGFAGCAQSGEAQINSTMFKFIVLLSTLLVAFARKNELVLDGDDKVGEVVKTRVVPKPRASLPANWDYRPLGLLTTDLNQHIPVYW